MVLKVFKFQADLVLQFFSICDLKQNFVVFYVWLAKIEDYDHVLEVIIWRSKHRQYNLSTFS